MGSGDHVSPVGSNLPELLERLARGESVASSEEVAALPPDLARALGQVEAALDAAREQVESHDARWRALMGSTAIGVAVVDAEGRPVVSNLGLQEILGFSADELRTKAFPEFTHPADIEIDVDLYGQLIRSEISSYRITKRYIRKDGRMVWGDLTVALIRGVDGDVKGAIGTVADITDRRRLEDTPLDSIERVLGALNWAPIPMMIHAEDGEVLLINEAWERLSGYRLEEIPTLQDWIRLAFEERAEEILLEIARQFDATGPTEAGEVTIRTASGGVRFWELRSCPLGRFRDGRRLLVTAGSDVTERRAITARLAQRMKELRCAYDVTRRMAEGGPLEQSLNNVAAAIPPGFQFPHLGCARVLLDGQSYGSGPFETAESVLSVPITISSERRGALEVCYTEPVAGDDGEVFLTEERSLILNLASIIAAGVARREAEVGLQRSNKELEQFAYIVSHDLNEPLRSIGGMLKKLSERYGEELAPNGHRFLAYALEGSERLQAMIEGLLTLSRVSTQRGDLTPLHIEDALVAAQASLSQLISETGAEIIAAELPEVLGNLSQLTQVFQNLIQNALKFRSVESPVVSVEAWVDGGMCQFSVRDNGVGIEPRDAERVFEIYRRVEREADPGGSGIGLSVCRRIVERHGGRIWVEPREPPGTDVRFKLRMA